MIPGFLTKGDIEFYSDGEEDFFISSGKIYRSSEAPEHIYDRIERFICRRPNISTGLDLLKITGRKERCIKVCRCLFPRFDLFSDFTDSKANTEYASCPQRSQCPAAGFICQELKDISDRELEVARLLTLDLSEKEIADRLGISVHTVHTHLKNMRVTINVPSKAGIVSYLYQNNLV